MKKIAVCSGGGVKGIIQCVALAKKERFVGDLTKYYDLMVGTSVGSINAAGLSSGQISATKMLSIYPDMLRRVFKKKLFGFPKYDRKHFCEVWSELGLDKLLMKDCKTRLMITSVDRCEDRNHYFKSWTQDGESNLMMEVCKSFAAPLYFGHMPDEKNRKVWTDGGCGTSNLSLDEAMIEAILLDWVNEEIYIDVYGCGFVDTKMSYEEAIKERTFKQIIDFLKPSEGGLARYQSLDDQVRRMKLIAKKFNNIHFEYWNIQIDKKHDGMDKLEFIDEYIKYGNEMSKSPLIKI